MLKGYVTFELGLLDGKVGNVRSEAGDSRVDDAFTWQVTSNDGAVTIHGVDGGKLCQIGRAAINDEAVMDARVGRTDTEPNDYQWQLVAQGFSSVWGLQVRIAGDPQTAEMDGGGARVRKRSAARSSASSAAPGTAASRIGVHRGVAAALFLGGLGLLIFLAVRKSHTAVPVSPPAPPPASTAAVAIAAPETEPPPPRPPSLEIQIATAPSLSRAIALAVPKLGDGVDNEGAWMLARYGSAKLTWNDAYVAEHETSFGLVLKDSDRERGKRMCATGKVRDIERQDLDQRPVYVGSLETADGDVARFIAVGSTGLLVKRSTATLCGVVTGKSDGAVMMVGLFDLPENQRPTVER